jgi:hypothetical protein
VQQTDNVQDKVSKHHGTQSAIPERKISAGGPQTARGGTSGAAKPPDTSRSKGYKKIRDISNKKKQAEIFDESRTPVLKR